MYSSIINLILSVLVEDQDLVSHGTSNPGAFQMQLLGVTPQCVYPAEAMYRAICSIFWLTSPVKSLCVSRTTNFGLQRPISNPCRTSHSAPSTSMLRTSIV